MTMIVEPADTDGMARTCHNRMVAWYDEHAECRKEGQFLGLRNGLPVYRNYERGKLEES